MGVEFRRHRRVAEAKRDEAPSTGRLDKVDDDALAHHSGPWRGAARRCNVGRPDSQNSGPFAGRPPEAFRQLEAAAVGEAENTLAEHTVDEVHLRRTDEACDEPRLRPLE